MKFLTNTLAIVILLMTGCTQNNETESIYLPLSFSTAVDAQTRVTDFTTDNLTSMGVFACFSQGNFNASTATPDFMYNQIVERTDAAAPWTYSPVKYWPNNVKDKISFFAYAPYNAVGVTASANNKTGYPSLTYTMPAEEAKQIDLLASNPSKNMNMNGGNVNFALQHALTKIDIYIKSDDLSAGKVVNSLSVTTPQSGTLTYKAEGFSWTSSADVGTIIATKTDVTVPSVKNETVLLGTFYMIPDRAKSLLNITYTLTGSISNNTNPPTDKVVVTGKTFPDAHDWTASAHIVYTINIGRTAMEITVENKDMEWGNNVVDETQYYLAEDLKIGDYYYTDGTYSDGGLRVLNLLTGASTLTNPIPDPKAGKTCAGVIFYAGKHPTDNCNYTTPEGNSMGEIHGYVVSLEDLGKCYETGGWVPSKVPPETNYVVGTSTDINDYKGYDNTHLIESSAQARGIWSTTYYYLPYHVLNNYNKPISSASSGWYMPSAGQVQDLYKYRIPLRASLGKLGKTLIGSIGGNTTQTYWTSTEVNAGAAYKFDGFNRDNGKLNEYYKGGRDATRPVFTF